MKVEYKFLILCLFVTFFIYSSSALTAESDSYSIGRLASSLQATNLNSENLIGQASTTIGATTRNAESEQFTTNIGFWSNTPYHQSVSINSYSLSPKSAPIGSTISLSISALNAQTVWAKITFPNNQEQTLVLINNQVVNYVPSSLALGRYDVIFYANSSSGEIASAVDYFELTEQPVTPSQIPSGGGSTNEKCSYIWDCTPWSLCSEGKQNRVCSNIGNCVGQEGKPKEKINCSEALFDISLKLKDLNLTSNGTLLSSIELAEKTGNEQVDIHIKYSIIDTNNTEIFSQIETKAIKKNLSFDKVLEDLILTEGDYTFRVDILYGNLQRAFAEQKFRIEKGKIINENTQNSPSRITGGAITTPSNSNEKTLLEVAIIVLLLMVLILLRRKVISLCKKLLNLFLKLKSLFAKHSKNSVLGLLNKKVYTENGQYVGKIEDVILCNSRIDSLRIKVDKKIKFESKGIVISHKHVKNFGEIVIVESNILDLK